MPVTVAVDAMGGDHGLPVTVAASLKFLENTPDARVILVGPEAPLTQALARARSRARDRVSVRVATEIVAMDEPPADARFFVRWRHEALGDWARGCRFMMSGCTGWARVSRPSRRLGG